MEVVSNIFFEELIREYSIKTLKNYLNSTFQQKTENVSFYLSIPKSTFEEGKKKQVQFCKFNNVYSIPDY